MHCNLKEDTARLNERLVSLLDQVYLTYGPSIVWNLTFMTLSLSTVLCISRINSIMAGFILAVHELWE